LRKPLFDGAGGPLVQALVESVLRGPPRPTAPPAGVHACGSGEKCRQIASGIPHHSTELPKGRTATAIPPILKSSRGNTEVLGRLCGGPARLRVLCEKVHVDQPREVQCGTRSNYLRHFSAMSLGEFVAKTRITSMPKSGPSRSRPFFLSARPGVAGLTLCFHLASTVIPGS